jgi:hypothetical protein
MTLREGYLHDSLAASLIGFLFALFAAGQAAGGAAGDMVKFTGLFIVYALFFVIPGGFVTAYLNFRLHRVGENLGMEGLNAGFFTAIVYTIITLFTTLISAIQSKDPGSTFLGWIITVLFSFVFYPLGGYICGYMEQRPYGMPSIFSMPRMSRAPPPPPPTASAQLCPTCGKPLTYVQQYNRWYCTNCKKYP